MTGYMIVECIGDSMAHTIGFVFLKREWAEHQLLNLREDAEIAGGVATFQIRVVEIVESGPND